MNRDMSALRDFVDQLGFNSQKIIDEMNNGSFDTCKRIALWHLKMVRDFSNTTFTESGVSMANKWLDSIQK